MDRVIKTTALVSGNSNCSNSYIPEMEEDHEDEENEMISETDGPRAIHVVANWEAIREGLLLLTTLVKNREIEDEQFLFTVAQFLVEIGSNSLHQGVLQQVHFSLIEILTHFYSQYKESELFLHMIAIILSIPVNIHLPIIRRSAGLPFMV